MSGRTAGELRERLVEIDDEIRGLSADDFAGKHHLLTESDECRELLRAQVGAEASDATKEWAERAGRKGSHEPNYEARKAMIISAAPDSSGAF